MNDFERFSRSKANATSEIEEEVRDLLQRAGPRRVVPVDDLAEIEAAARRQWRSLVEAERRRRGNRVVAGLALAASLIVAVSAVWWWNATATPETGMTLASVEALAGEIGGLAVGSHLEAGAEIDTLASDGRPARLALRLAGGQSLRLDSDTKVRIVSGHRFELERGAVYFDSGAAASGSGGIEVATAFGTVRDIGTQFEVRLDGGAITALRVRVREGEVRLETNGETHSAARGEELLMEPDGSVAVAAVEPFGTAWAWTSEVAPGFDIEGATLEAFLTWISRETGWQVQYADGDLERSAATVELRGTIEGLTPDESVSVVLPASGLGYRVEGGTLLVSAG